MPELPEVNTYQKYFDTAARNKLIREVEVQDDYIIKDLNGAAFREKLRGQTFSGSYRRGKYLFGELDNGHHLLLHFGMSGDLKLYNEPEEAPKHERFHFAFESGERLGFDCPRKFARIRYIEDLQAYLKEKKLGPDALNELEWKTFQEIRQGKKGTLKGFLLNQRYLAGVGNLYADEICYQCRIHPASRVDRLPEKKWKEVFEKMKDILQTAVDRDAYYRHYPDDWFWKWREEGAEAPDGSTIEKTEVAGRTTYFAGKWQKRF